MRLLVHEPSQNCTYVWGVTLLGSCREKLVCLYHLSCLSVPPYHTVSCIYHTTWYHVLIYSDICMIRTMSTALIRTTWYGVIYSDFCPTNFLLWYHLRIIQIVHRITGSGSAMMAWSQGGWRSSKKLRRFAVLLWLCRQLWPLAHACQMQGKPLWFHLLMQGRTQDRHMCSHPARHPRWDEARCGWAKEGTLQPEAHGYKDSRWEEVIFEAKQS